MANGVISGFWPSLARAAGFPGSGCVINGVALGAAATGTGTGCSMAGFEVPNNYPGCAPVGAVHARGSAERSPGQDFSAGSLRKGICSRSESSHPTVRAAEPERGPEQESGPHSKTLREALKWTRIPDGSGWAFYRRQRKGWSVGAWEREPHISSRVRRLRIRNLCAETVLN